MKSYFTQYYIDNKENIKNSVKQYANLNKDAISAKNKKRRLENLDFYRERDKKQTAKRKDKKTAYDKTLYHENMQRRISCCLRNRLGQAIKGRYKSGFAVADLGCTIEHFINQHIPSLFKEGMSWENYGEWEIDHIVPLISFDLANREELLKACNYTNLQPLWASENRSKGDR